MAGTSRSISFVSVYTKGNWSLATLTYGPNKGKQAYVKPGYDDGQPEKGLLRRLSDNAVWEPDNRTLWYANISDVVGNRRGINPYTFIRYKTAFEQVCGYSAPNGAAWPGYDMQNLCMGNLYSVQDPLVYFPNLTSLETKALVNQTLQRANPSAPVVSLPIFLTELRELPQSLLTYGEKLLTAVRKASYLRRWNDAKSLSDLFRDSFYLGSPKARIKRGARNAETPRNMIPTLENMWTLVRKSLDEAAQANLTYRWGVRPFVSDIVRLFGLQKSIDSRVRKLEKLYQRGRFGRRITLPARQAVTLVSGPRVLWSAAGGGTTGVLRQVLRERVWGSVKYRLPDDRNPPKWLMSDQGRRDIAERIAFGMTGYEALSLLWEITPNSWLSDWFFGLGDYIAANNNTLNLIAYDVCLMRHLRTTAQWSITNRPAWQYSARSVPGFFERKTRTVSLPAVVQPTYGLPILTKGQWSIVASLALSQRR